MRHSTLRRAAAAACCVLLLACSPKFDWREVHGSAAPYSALLPAKPATHARDINLDGLPVTMTMTGAEVDSVTYAIGTIELAEPAQAAHALNAMRTALVRNIHGTVTQEKSSAPADGTTMLELEANGPLPQGRRLLQARLIARERHVYQLLVVGDERDFSREAADTFFTSFRLSSTNN
ncbi:MAG TPA: hypothetical protein VM406_01285 [Noviherbaspirillum sp.]|nr:hypothetical protein [Noviherbaspirillum sp.]